VLVDFWADWCQPCKMLMPVLAKLAEEYQGKFILAKLNTEADQELAAYFRIRSIPTCKLFKDGREVDEFMGALPEAQLRAFLDRHIEKPVDEREALVARLLEQGDFEAARQRVAEALQAEPENAAMRLLAAQIEAADGNIDAAQAILDDLSLKEAQSPEVAALRSELFFYRAVQGAPAPQELAQRVAAGQGGSEAQYQLACHQTLAGDFEGALERLLDLLKKDRAYGDDAARKAMVAIFNLLGNEGEFVAAYRGRMARALY